MTLSKTYPQLLFGILLSIFINTDTFAQCNGDDNVCDKKYNEVAYLTTHNAFNSIEDNFMLPNQNTNIATQLASGVRALMLDVYELNGETVVYHSVNGFGTAPLVQYLMDIENFLADNPKEIVTIIFECYTTANAIETEVNNAALQPYLYTHNADESWQTLQTMIDNNSRLVIFTDVNDASPEQAWYHYVWDYAVETHFSNNSLDDFSCDFNRGNPDNDLFILNHFITLNGFGTAEISNTANSNPFFINRVLECQEATGKVPNFITVDFYEFGNCFDVINQVNSSPISALNTPDNFSNKVNIFPNPVSSHLSIQSVLANNFHLKILNTLGQDVSNKTSILQSNQNEWTIDVSNLQNGMYFIQTSQGTYKILVQ